jgi:hypothetical protein
VHTAHTHQTKIAYAIAAVPAVFLPLSYLVMVVWVFATIFTALFSGKHAADPSEVVLWVWQAGYYATLIQWPFYLLWAASTPRLTLRVRMLWIVVLILLNMFAMPWFLFCMYRRTAQTALTRGIGRESVRRFFERGSEHKTHAA